MFFFVVVVIPGNFGILQQIEEKEMVGRPAACAPTLSIVRKRELCVTPLAVILGLLLLYVLHIILTPTVTP